MLDESISQAVEQAQDETEAVGFYIPYESAWVRSQPNQTVMAFELMCQFAARCHEEGKNGDRFRQAASNIACPLRTLQIRNHARAF